jgi:YD repeat-containing protein
MKRLIRKILREQFNYKEKIFNLLNSGNGGLIEMVKYISEGQGYNLIELLLEYFQEYDDLQYVNIFNNLNLTEEEKEKILKHIYGDDHKIFFGENIYIQDSYGNEIFVAYHDGYWDKFEYEIGYRAGELTGINSNYIYYENSNGYWEKREYDDKGNVIYVEYDDGWWEKWEYDDKGKRIYWENSNGIINDYR